MIKINLVPQEILDSERQRMQSIQAVIIVILLALGVSGLTFVRWSTLRAADAELSAVNRDYQDHWAAIGAQLDEKKRAVDALKTRLGVITDLLNGRSLYPHFMADMARMMPTEIFLTNVATTRGTTNITVTAQAVSLTYHGIAHWVKMLAQPAIFGSFAEPNISAITISDDPVTNAKQYSFTISTIYNHRS